MALSRIGQLAPRQGKRFRGAVSSYNPSQACCYGGSVIDDCCNPVAALGTSDFPFSSYIAAGADEVTVADPWANTSPPTSPPTVGIIDNLTGALKSLFSFIADTPTPPPVVVVAPGPVIGTPKPLPRPPVKPAGSGLFGLSPIMLLAVAGGGYYLYSRRKKTNPSRRRRRRSRRR